MEASAGGGGRVSSIVAPDSHPEFGIFGGNIIFGAKQQDISLPAQGLAFLTISIHQSTTYYQNPPRTRFSHLPLALMGEHRLPVLPSFGSDHFLAVLKPRMGGLRVKDLKVPEERYL